MASFTVRCRLRDVGFESGRFAPCNPLKLGAEFSGFWGSGRVVPENGKTDNFGVVDGSIMRPPVHPKLTAGGVFQLAIFAHEI